LDNLKADAPKLRLLRVLNVVATALVYCAQNAGPLFVMALLPCALDSASRLGLEWLIYSYPPKLPAELLSRGFSPPTWLTALTMALWSAMAWAFILRFMADRDAHRGLITARILRPLRLRFELSGPILGAAVILAADNLVGGMSRQAVHELLVMVYREGYVVSDNTLETWASLAAVIRIALATAVSAWLSIIAGSMLLHERFDIAGPWRLMRGNRLRLAAIFFVLTIALMALDQLVDPAKTKLVRSLTDPTTWTLNEAALRYAVDFPFSMLWIVTWAVMVGIVLDALGRAPSDVQQRP
jgi:hypothetical protein